jgi:hypothetical protein
MLLSHVSGEIEHRAFQGKIGFFRGKYTYFEQGETAFIRL